MADAAMEKQGRGGCGGRALTPVLIGTAVWGLAAGGAQAEGFFAVVTRDAAPLIAWYEAAFDARVARTLQPPGRDIVVHVLDGPDVTIEIQQNAAATPATGRVSGRVGVMKAGFQVQSLEPWLTRWRAMNATIIAGPFDDPAPPMRSVVLLDPDGNSIHVTAPIAPDAPSP